MTYKTKFCLIFQHVHTYTAAQLTSYWRQP